MCSFNRSQGKIIACWAPKRHRNPSEKVPLWKTKYFQHNQAKLRTTGHRHGSVDTEINLCVEGQNIHIQGDQSNKTNSQEQSKSSSPLLRTAAVKTHQSFQHLIQVPTNQNINWSQHPEKRTLKGGCTQRRVYPKTGAPRGYHVSCVTYQVSHVTCHVSRVACPLSHVTIFSFF